jgi:hypothetical protein
VSWRACKKRKGERGAPYGKGAARYAIVVANHKHTV